MYLIYIYIYLIYIYIDMDMDMFAHINPSIFRPLDRVMPSGSSQKLGLHLEKQPAGET